MNVSPNAYFTSEYLQDRHFQQKRNLRIDPGSRQSRTTKIDEGPQTPVTSSSDKVSAESDSPPEPPIHQNDLMREITPAELNYLAPQQSSHRKSRPSVDYSGYYGSRQPYVRPQNQNKIHRSFFRKPGSHGDDESFEYPYNSHDETFFRGDDTSLYEPSIPNPQAFSGFYIDQQKRYNESQEVKPNMYTHKTFKDIFGRDEEERLNPADVVFDDPSKRIPRGKQKLTRAFKLMRNKFGKNDYASYDYNQPYNDEGPQSLVVKCEDDKAQENDGESVSTSDHSQINTTTSPTRSEFDSHDVISVRSLTEENSNTWMEVQQADSQSTKFRSRFRRKWRIGKHFSESTSDLGDVISNDGPTEVSQDDDLQEMSEPGAHGSVVANGFGPLWSYALSWLVYNDTEVPEAEKDKITELREATESAKITSSQALTNARNKDTKSSKSSSGSRRPGRFYKEILQNWNQPASAYISGDVQQLSGQNITKSPSSRAMNYKHNTAEEGSDDQFFYNPETGQLEYVESGSEVEIQQPRVSVGTVHEGTPKTIISNVNKLIKNIRIMKIIFAPIDVVAENFPRTQTFVILIELFIFVWILYELSLLIDALCMAVRAICAPMIAVGKFMNRIV